jgi:hypothetical protein
MRHVSHDVETGLKDAFGLHRGDNVVVSSRPHLYRCHSRPHEKDIMADAPESTQGLVVDLSVEPDELAVVCRDEEDEWVSDQSSSEEAPAEKEHQRTVKTTVGRGGKKRRTDRQRPSAHGFRQSRVPHLAPINVSTSIESNTAPTTVPSTPAPDLSRSPAPETSSTDVADEEPRGRAPPTSDPSTYAARRRPRPLRVVSLRGSETGSREVSPARSIRWADAGAGASPATVRWSRPPSAQGSRAPSPGLPTSGEPAEKDTG